MNWVAKNIVWWAVSASVALAIAFFFRKSPAVRKNAGRACLSFLALLIVGTIHLASSAPGLEDTDKQIHPFPIKPVNKDLARLQSDWNSEADSAWPVAETLAKFCQAAYQPPIDADATYRSLGAHVVETFVDRSMVGYVVKMDDVSVVVFRGTDDNLDWFCNLDSFTVATKNGRIHRGFRQAYLPLKQQILKALDKQRPEHLWICGHSLGGALALICAHDLIENEGRDLRGVITFGQPMVADAELAAHLDKMLLGKFAHFVNGADIVPRIPPAMTHCGSLVWFAPDGIRRSRPKRVFFGDGDKMQLLPDEIVLPPVSVQEFEKAKRSMRKRPEPRKLPDGTIIVEGNSPFLKDHSMDLYFERVRNSFGALGAIHDRPAAKDKH